MENTAEAAPVIETPAETALSLETEEPAAEVVVAEEPAPAAVAEIAPSPAPRKRKWLSNHELTILSLVVVIKTLLFVYGASAYQVYKNKMLPTTMERFEIWHQWDAAHYVGIAASGYQAGGEWYFRLVFYPLYPWLSRACAYLTRDYHTGALLVSTIASFALAILFYRLLRLDETAHIARQAVVFLFIFPTSYFLHIAYTESLFLLLALGSFYAARKERWWLAGILGALAAFTRVNGLLLGPALLVEAYLQYREKKRWEWNWAALSLIGAGLLGYLFVNYVVSGKWFRFQEIQREKWTKYLTSPHVGIRELFNGLSWRPPWEKHMVCMEELIFIALALLVVVWCVRRARPSYTVWTALNTLLFISTSFIQSTPRYTLILFPMFVMFARAAARPLWGTLIPVWSILFLSFFVSLFVQGKWAF
jgi:hypothetical protein